MRVFTVPYDSGHEGLRMGAGPLRLQQELGVDAERIDAPAGFRREITTSFTLYATLASRIAETDDFPVVLSGNCGAAIGAACGVGIEDLGVIWFDAHGDYNTPDTTDSGFLDGMALSILTGRCFHALTKTIPRFAPVPPRRTIHLGARDYSPGEREALLDDGVAVVEPSSLDDVEARLDALDVRRVLVHVDLDVLDPRFGRANPYAVDGGLSPEDIHRVISAAAARFPIAALVLASYDPTCDEDGRVAKVGAELVRVFTPPAPRY